MPNKLILNINTLGITYLTLSQKHNRLAHELDLDPLENVTPLTKNMEHLEKKLIATKETLVCLLEKWESSSEEDITPNWNLIPNFWKQLKYDEYIKSNESPDNQ
ncbi:hypothetical protein [Salmon gill poxvirus]